ncbi:alpha/beta fold hydrolase [Novosphingobium sp. B 225]|uniref:alpha/beta fold hydrolase n=1 Tax=Novosphingobium sp. B 225 TaxID=1961849 RepID=UPI000B4BB5E2|nr:alpha/beta hydrolase [Novosphingobium sp. B 225]
MKSILKVLGWLLVVAAITLYTFRDPDSDPKAMVAKYGAPPSKFLKLPDGQIIHMRDEGPADAPVIVLLHGSNADLHTWGPWTDQLKGKYRVIRLDQIGHGLTGADSKGDYSPQGFANRLAQVVDALGLKQFALAGNSMGGGIAIRYALDHPERLSALVLVDAAGAPQTEKAKGNLAYTLLGIPGGSLVMQQVTPRSMIEKSLRQSVANQAIVTDAAVDRYWELLRYPGNRQATMERMALPRVPYSQQQFAQLKMPVMVMWGEEDSLIPLSSGKLMASLIPGSTLVTYPGIGHIPMEEAAQRSAGDLATWLAAHGVPGKPG